MDMIAHPLNVQECTRHASGGTAVEVGRTCGPQPRGGLAGQQAGADGNVHRASGA